MSGNGKGRSDNLTKGAARAPRRSLLKGLGFIGDEMEKPIIGIANSFNEIIPGHVHLKNLVQAVKDGIRMAGGVPMEFNTIGICDGLAMNHIGMKYSLVTRNIIADSIEAVAMATPFDAIVFMPSCDKVVPGMLIAAARLNIPSIFVSGGAMLAGVYKGKKIGSVADFTTFSFHAVKNFTTAEGGSVTWKQNENFDNEELYREYQIYSLHGQTKDALAKTKAGSWEYDIVIPGYKCNLTDIAASIGLVQLDRYPKLLERREDIIDQYNKGFAGTRITALSHSSEDYKSCGHLYITHVEGATFEQRGEIIVKMAERGISCNVHYKPLPLLTAYKNLGFDIENYPNAYNYYVKEITLPLHTRLSDEDVAVIIENFKEIVEEVVGE